MEVMEPIRPIPAPGAPAAAGGGGSGPTAGGVAAITGESDHESDRDSKGMGGGDGDDDDKSSIDKDGSGDSNPTRQHGKEDDDPTASDATPPPSRTSPIAVTAAPKRHRLGAASPPSLQSVGSLRQRKPHDSSDTKDDNEDMDPRSRREKADLDNDDKEQRGGDGNDGSPSLPGSSPRRDVVAGDLVFTSPSKLGRSSTGASGIRKTASLASKVGSIMGARDESGAAEPAQWTVFVNDEAQNQQEFQRHGIKVPYVQQNAVTTSKYTTYNFLVLNLGEQFSRLANVYFLVIAGLQLFTPLSPTGRFSTVVPLALVVSANMIREIWEDSKRHQDDKSVNHRKVKVIGHSEEVYWKNLKVGDIIRVEKNKEVPADIVQLCSSDEQGGSYIDTCNLDGETNLKIKSSLPITQHDNSPEALRHLKGSLHYEPPNKNLYRFIGTATLEERDKTAVGIDYVLLRGSVLRNTDYIYGLIVYAGKQSKIQMNSRAATIKRSNVERMANWILGGVFLFELVMCTLGCSFNYSWASTNQSYWYLPYVQQLSAVDIVYAWISYFILLNNYIPISLYVSMELSKLGQKILIDNDMEMYHELTDTPCLARTSNLNEELGQIEYIFSDKTGTLTRNEMEFRKCWIAGTSYGFGTTEIGLAAAARGALLASDDDVAERANADPEKAQYFYDPKIAFDDVRLRQRVEDNHLDAPVIRDFFRVLSVAHTVVPEWEDGAPHDRIKYQAESPDEGALVLAAKALGFFFCGKNATSHTVNIFGELQRFDILNINKFNSTRKRMSAVVRTPDGKLELYIKGADNVMFDLLDPRVQTASIGEAIKCYGKEGLRTLIIAKRSVSEEEYARWSDLYLEASTAITQRDERLMEAAEQIEQNLEILGATAIEDKLQIGVPETIATLARAQIRIWVLTGDKQETAENIGFACNLLTNEMKRCYLVDDNVKNISATLDDGLQEYAQFANLEDPCETLSLLVDGKALIVIMKAFENEQATTEEMDLMLRFLAFAKMCKSVIACRVSPDQKRQIVGMVKNHSKPTPLTLSIGDGANDVPMILEASVGIGISGNEGMQAVRSSDYAIAQFAFLKRLLLVHGRSNYKRISIVVMYSLYKNCFLVSTLFLYGFLTGWTGTAIFDSFMLAGFNVFWAFIGVILYGSIERDVSCEAALKNPQLYITGAKKKDFNGFVLLQWELTAFWHTVLCLLVPTYCFYGKNVLSEGYDEGAIVFGLCVMTSLVISVNLKLMLITCNLSYLSLLAYVGSVLLFIVGAVAHSTWLLSSFFATEYYFFYDIAFRTFAAPSTWLVELLTVAVVMLLDFVATYVRRTYLYSAADIVREIDLGLGPGAAAARDGAPPADLGEEGRRRPYEYDDDGGGGGGDGDGGGGVRV